MNTRSKRYYHASLWLTTTTTTLINLIGSNKSNQVNALLDHELLQRAKSLQDKIGPFPSFDNVDLLYYPSAYNNSKNSKSSSSSLDGSSKESNKMRGFCNWIIPNYVMIGQYPGQNPEISGPNANEVQDHLQTIINDAGINLFCSLQDEIPPQNDYQAWEATNNNGVVFLPEKHLRKQFPNPFTHYAPIAKEINPNVQFMHAPVIDLSVPDFAPLQKLLLDLIIAMDDNDNNNDNNNRVVYLHCWGGRGRAGLVGSCLLSLLYPTMDAKSILQLIQAGYDTRLGAKDMPLALSKSPQTNAQREFVKKFVKIRQEKK